MGEPLVWASTEGQRPGAWVWSQSLDGFWIGGGGFFLFLLIAAPLSLHPQGPVWCTVAFLHLSILCNYPHYTSTYQVIVRERAQRPEGVRWLILSVPVMLALFAAGAVWEGVGWSLIMRLYLTWSAHHYAAQNFGIASMYSHRQGVALEAREKALLQFAFLGLGVYMMVMANALVGGLSGNANGVVGVVGGLTIPTAELPAWVYGPALALMLACLVAFAATERSLKRRLGRGLPNAARALFAINFTWFALPNLYLPGGEGLLSPAMSMILVGATPFFHCAQYLGLTLDRSRKTGAVKPIWLYTGLVAYGFILFHAPLPVLPSLTGLSTLKGAFLLIAIINIHHFWMDGLMWRRRKPASPPLRPLTPQLAR